MSRTDEPEWVSPNPWHEVEDVYLDALDGFNRGKTVKAIRLALHLARLLEKLDPHCESLLGMAGRALIAELDGDYQEAIRYRKLELAGVKKLLAEVKPDVLEAIKMDASDYSDRLDLLACVYLDAGQYDDALAALAESEAFCQEHGIPFDGKDIRADVKRAMRRKRAAKAKAG
jgi:hypothetical protein